MMFASNWRRIPAFGWWINIWSYGKKLMTSVTVLEKTFPAQSLITNIITNISVCLLPSFQMIDCPMIGDSLIVCRLETEDVTLWPGEWDEKCPKNGCTTDSWATDEMAEKKHGQWKPFSKSKSKLLCCQWKPTGFQQNSNKTREPAIYFPVKDPFIARHGKENAKICWYEIERNENPSFLVLHYLQLYTWQY